MPMYNTIVSSSFYTALHQLPFGCHLAMSGKYLRFTIMTRPQYDKLKSIIMDYMMSGYVTFCRHCVQNLPSTGIWNAYAALILQVSAFIKLGLGSKHSIHKSQ